MAKYDLAERAQEAAKRSREMNKKYPIGPTKKVAPEPPESMESLKSSFEAQFGKRKKKFGDVNLPNERAR